MGVLLILSATLGLYHVRTVLGQDSQAEPERGTATLAGQVLGGWDRHVLPDARVEIPVLRRGYRTDELGRFWIDGIPPGTQTVRIVRRDYETQEHQVELQADSTNWHWFRLRTEAEAKVDLYLRPRPYGHPISRTRAGIADESDTGAVHGRVTDSQTGEPVADILVIALNLPFYMVTTTTEGYYAMDHLPPGLRGVRFLCPSRRFPGKKIAEENVALVSGASMELNVTVDPGFCWEPPPDRHSGRMTGVWSRGFELSAFTACPGAFAHLEPAFSQQELAFIESSGTRIWVDWSADAISEFDWPRGLDDGYTLEHFVVLEGRLIGPAVYGHMGMAAYLLEVEQVLEAAMPGEKRCEMR